MSGPWRYAVVPIIIALAWTCVTALGDPSLEITSPEDGSTVVTHACNVTGTARGSDFAWFQGTLADFEGGIRDDVVVDDPGGVRLARRVEDNFDDNSLSTNAWTAAGQGGLSSVEEGKALHIKGTSNSASYWSSSTSVTSAGGISTFVQAVLTWYTGTGTGYSTSLTLYQDGSNYVGIGERHDQSWGAGVFLYTVSNVGGTYAIEQWASLSSHPHTYRITYSGSVAGLYQDGAEVATVSISLTSPKVILSGTARTTGDTIDAKWDSVISEYTSAGSLTSSVHDTRSVDPVLLAAAWNSTVPVGSQIVLEFRSGPDPDMSAASPWQAITNGQTSGFPDGERYMQYRARLSTADQLVTPVISDVTISYNKPVARVELSSDDRATWTAAVGNEQWWAVLDLPEGPSRIWARATDVAGDINETTVAVDVDTTPPEGAVLIDGGDPFTAVRDVTVTLQATDLHGVTEMLVSARQDFSDTVWIPFATVITVTLSAGDGPKTVYARFKDGNGLASAAVDDTILLDTQAPVGTVEIDGGAGYTNSTVVHLTMNATDPSGVADYMVSERPDFAGAAWIAFAERADHELTAVEGEKTLYATWRDALGHVSAAVEDSILMDLTAPVLTMAIEDGAGFTSVQRVQLSFEVTEAAMVASVQVGEDPALLGAPPMTFQPRLEWVLLPEDGTKTVYARAWDFAGNVGPTASASIVLDTVPPAVTISIEGGEVYTLTALVTVEMAVVDQSPVGDMELGEDPGLSTAVVTSFKSPMDITLSPGDGVKTFYVRVHDAAGNVGPIASASIILDTTPPTLTMSMQGGAVYTTAREVNVAMVAVDISGLAQMQLGEDPTLAGAASAPFANGTSWTLSPGDGLKVLFGRVIDIAGNRGPITYASIVLDTVPPTSAMDPLAAVSRDEDVVVSWRGVDATAGVALFDVQCSDNGGVWTDLLVGTNSTRTTFKGEDGHTYSFRVRSQDIAGNREAYPEAVTDGVRIDIPEPAETLPQGLMLTVVIVVAIVACVGAGYALSRRRRGDAGPPDADG